MNTSIKQLEETLWESADELRADSKISSNEYFMPVLGLIFLRYAYSRYKMVEAEILPTLPQRNGKTRAITADDFRGRSAIFLPREAQYEFIVNLPEDVASANVIAEDGHQILSLYEVLNNAMTLIERNSKQLEGILPKNYEILGSDALLARLLRIFNNTAIDEVGGDVFGRIYEYFLNKFSKVVAQDDGVFFTPKSLVKMIVNVLEPKEGKFLDPACGSGGMFVQTGDFITEAGEKVNQKMTFYGQEKVELNAKICLMNIAVHGLNGKIIAGEQANSFYHDAHNLEGKCDYVMANPPFNVDKVKQESAVNAGRIPFGCPAYNEKTKQIGNANYLWIQYFYAYLKPTGRAGFVMASSATDSGSKDKDIRQQLIETGHVDCMLSVGNRFFYTKSLPCTLWFFDKGKRADLKPKTLFIDARNYYTEEDSTHNIWTDWQLKNLSAIVWLYRGEKDKYLRLVGDYQSTINRVANQLYEAAEPAASLLDEDTRSHFTGLIGWIPDAGLNIDKLKETINGQLQQTRLIFGSNFGKGSRKAKEMRAIVDEFCNLLIDLRTTVDEYEWLTSKFGLDGEYQDVAGLCKIASQEEIKEKNYSLTPGAYVGVAEVQRDEQNFAHRMHEIHKELSDLQSQSVSLMDVINSNFEDLGL